MEDGRVRLYVIGQGALSTAAAANTKHDIAKAEQWNFPIILIVLLAVFGSLAAAAIPLALGICTVAITMGLVYLLSAYTTMSVFVTSTVSMFGIALAVDYSLFILMRFREELRAGRQPQEAVDAAMATSGLAVALSGMTVVASLTGIYLIDTPALASMATGAILAVAVAMLTSTTMTPAVLATFGRSAAKRSAALHWSRRPETTQSRFWTHWIGGVMRRPWASALAASAVLLAMAVPALSMVLGNSLLRQFNSSHEIRAGVSAASEALGPGALGPVQVLVTFPDGDASSAAHAQTLAAIRKQIGQAPNIISVAPPVFADNNSSAMLSGGAVGGPRGPRRPQHHRLDARPPSRGRRRIGAGECRRTDRADQRLRRPGVQDPVAGAGLRRADRLRDAAALDSVGVPGVQGRADDDAVGGRGLRQPGDGLPVGLAGKARVRADHAPSTAPFRRWCWR